MNALACYNPGYAGSCLLLVVAKAVAGLLVKLRGLVFGPDCCSCGAIGLQSTVQQQKITERGFQQLDPRYNRL